MRFNFKKITAIGSSLLLAGMSVAVPIAAENYPAPFVKAGVADVAIVHGTGEGFSYLDVLEAGNIQSNLQSFMGAADGEDGTTITGESMKFEKSTDKLNIGDNLTDIITVPIDDEDLPTILADGTYSNAENSDFDYEQKIEVSDDIEFAHWADSEYNSKEPSLGIRIAKNNLVLNYTLDFAESAEDDTASGDDLDDFEDTEIEFLGKTYDITTAVNTSGITKFTLMSGAVKDTLDLYEIKDYTVGETSYEVELSYVDDSDNCRFNVNGEPTDKITKGRTDKLSDGTYIGVADVDYSTGAITEIMRCKFYLGADKIVLEDTKEVEINDDDVDELRVYFDETNGNPFKLNKMILEWKAEDDLFVTEDSEITMPGFGSVKLTSGGLTTETEEKISVKGESDYVIGLTVTLKSGETTIELLGSNETGGFDQIGGDDAGEGLATSAGASAELIFNDSADGDQYFVATYLSGADGSSYLVEVDADDTDGVTFKDAITNSELASKIKNDTSFTIGDATIELNDFIEGNYVNMTAGTNTFFDKLVTNEGMVIYLPVDSTTSTTSPYINLTALPTSYILYMEEEDKDGKLKSGDDVNVSLSHTSSNKVEAKITSTEEAVYSGGEDLEDPDDDNLFIGYVESALGTKVMYDSDPDEDTVEIFYHGTQAYGNIFISETEAVVSETATTTATGATTLGDILVKDTEISQVSGKNLIIVGGSCINSAAATALGVSSGTCGSDFTDATNVGAGEFLIKGVMDKFTTGKLALVVAGYNAADTVNAAKYLRTQVVDTSKEYKGTSATSATLVTTETGTETTTE